jgi:hypothetical protein
VTARAFGVQVACEDLFTGAGLALNQHRDALGLHAQGALLGLGHARVEGDLVAVCELGRWRCRGERRFAMQVDDVGAVPVQARVQGHLS